jgi:hydroxyethylthiazole kinase-like uncharacterized protein yjeF
LKTVTPKQMQMIDKMTIEEMGIPGIILMENAAFRVVEQIEKMLGCLKKRKILIVAGKGNNGGDAFAVARQLAAKEAETYIYTIADRASIHGDAAINLNILYNSGFKIFKINDSESRQNYERLKSDLGICDMVVDGLFGTGFRGEIEGVVGEIVAAINSSVKPVLSIDIPSGVDGNNGHVSRLHIKASVTVTFALPKLGLILHPGCDCTGELVVADIGIPKKVIDKMSINTYLIDERMVAGLIPSRENNSNKGDFGRILVITGSEGMTGAGCLAGRAALRAGAGLVYLAVPSSLSHIYDCMLMETITCPIEDHGKGYISLDSTERISELMEGKTVIVAGPGLSVNEDTVKIAEYIINKTKVPLILDADALNCIARDISVLKKLKAAAVMTPHPGEMARLTGMSIQDIQRNRVEIAVEYARQWNVTIVLKGYRTVVASPDGQVYINSTGNPGMSTAGTGDVLAGIIAALAGQGLSLTDAAVAGVYLHGVAGDRAAALKGEPGMIASDVIDELPAAFHTILLRKQTF